MFGGLGDRTDRVPCHLHGLFRHDCTAKLLRDVCCAVVGGGEDDTVCLVGRGHKVDEPKDLVGELGRASRGQQVGEGCIRAKVEKEEEKDGEGEEGEEETESL